ncbi:HopJ type III effector protein [Formosa sediminum]|uniref:HopJ type III effector protein n=1 Tax=Formosa sediminum TaxID=2594004 RepID=A0A516GP36_9FLAO|nr:HopJ type III effector protein [Formosa sediminum]QDO93259.1 HopJ type III effector protein [Formosa sediminum]
MTLNQFIETLKTKPKTIVFSDTMEVIDSLYDFTPTAFKNGEIYNKAGENSGSCKLFAFAKLQGFSKDETLSCFGQFYYIDVLGDPEGKGHQNIRNFINSGFDGLQFEGEALKLK